MFPKANIQDWRLWWQMIHRRIWIPIISVSLSIVIGLYVSLTSEPEYESSSTIMIMDTDLLSGSNLRFVPTPPRQLDVEFLTRLITSDDFLIRLLDSLEIEQNPKLHAEIQALWLEHPEISREEIAQQVYIKTLREHISTRTKGYNLIQFNARAESPDKAYELCALITYQAIQETQDRQLHSLTAANTLSAQLLSTYKEKLREAEDQLKRFDRGESYRTSQPETLSAERQKEIESVLLSTRIERAAKEEELQSYVSQFASGAFSYRPALESRIDDEKTKLLHRTENVSTLLKQFNWRDIEVVQINEEIAKLKKSIFDEIKRFIYSEVKNHSSEERGRLLALEKIRVEVSVLETSERTFESILKSNQAAQVNQPSRRVIRERLARNLDTNRRIYEMLLQQIQGTQIRESAQVKDAQMRYQIISPPFKPLDRIKPNRKRIMLISLFLGGLVGIGIIALFESFDLSIKYLNEVEDYLDVPVLATIPKLNQENLKKKRLKQALMISVPLLTAFTVLAYNILK